MEEPRNLKSRYGYVLHYGGANILKSNDWPHQPLVWDSFMDKVLTPTAFGLPQLHGEGFSAACSPFFPPKGGGFPLRKEVEAWPSCRGPVAAAPLSRGLSTAAAAE